MEYHVVLALRAEAYKAEADTTFMRSVAKGDRLNIR